MFNKLICNEILNSIIVIYNNSIIILLLYKYFSTLMEPLQLHRLTYRCN